MSDDLLASAVNAATDAKPGCANDLELFVKEVSKQFVEQRLDRFPWYCYEARRVNFIQRKELEKAGNAGGWSEDKSFKFDYEIPRDLYLFMVNLVYRNFWEEDNEKVWRKFMKGICRGDDPMDWLKALKIYYGSSQSLQSTGEL